MDFLLALVALAFAGVAVLSVQVLIVLLALRAVRRGLGFDRREGRGPRSTRRVDSSF